MIFLLHRIFIVKQCFEVCLPNFEKIVHNMKYTKVFVKFYKNFPKMMFFCKILQKNAPRLPKLLPQSLFPSSALNIAARNRKGISQLFP